MKLFKQALRYLHLAVEVHVSGSSVISQSDREIFDVTLYTALSDPSRSVCSSSYSCMANMSTLYKPESRLVCKICGQNIYVKIR